MGSPRKNTAGTSSATVTVSDGESIAGTSVRPAPTRPTSPTRSGASACPSRSQRSDSRPPHTKPTQPQSIVIDPRIKPERLFGQWCSRSKKVGAQLPKA